MIPADMPDYYREHPADASLLEFARRRPEGQPVGVVEAAAAIGRDASAVGVRIMVLRSCGAWPWPQLPHACGKARSDAAIKAHIARREARCKPR